MIESIKALEALLAALKAKESKPCACGGVIDAQQPAPEDVPQFKRFHLDREADSMVYETDVGAWVRFTEAHAACIRLERERDEALSDCEATSRQLEAVSAALALFENRAEEAETAAREISAAIVNADLRADMAMLKRQHKAAMADARLQSYRAGLNDRTGGAISDGKLITLEQHEAALKQARREERERCGDYVAATFGENWKIAMARALTEED
jgi:hypothetical protein